MDWIYNQQEIEYKTKPYKKYNTVKFLIEKKLYNDSEIKNIYVTKEDFYQLINELLTDILDEKYLDRRSLNDWKLKIEITLKKCYVNIDYTRIHLEYREVNIRIINLLPFK